MELSRPALALVLLPCIAYAQSDANDTSFLKQAREKYDAPFERGLESFDCAVQFDWKEHFKEVVRLGDEGTDTEVAEQIQPIHTRVVVTQKSVTPTANLTEEQIAKLNHGGMAEELLEHAVQYSMDNWRVAANNQILPPAETAVNLVSTSSGPLATFRIQQFNVDLKFTKDMRLESEGVRNSPSDRRETQFSPGPTGFVLTSVTTGENGDFKPGNRVIETYSYQTVSGYQLPEQVSILRESHRQGWHYKLTGCKVKARD